MKTTYYPNIRAEMARRNMSSDDMAAALSINVTTWRARLRGTHPFTATELRIMSSMFGDCPFEYLIEGSPT